MDMNNLTRIGGTVLLTLKKYSPEILVGTGAVAIVASGVMLVKATLKAEPIITSAASDLDLIEALDSTEAEKREMSFGVRKSTALSLTRLYAPAVTTGVVGIVCVLGGNHILRQRNIAIAGAYKALEFSYSEYRKRVQGEVGEERELQLYRNQQHVMVEDPNGGKKKVRKVVQGDGGYSQYAFLFSPETSSLFDRSAPEFNQFKIRSVQNWANDMLRVRGHVFLNEIFDYLGMERSAMGSLVGWVYDAEMGDHRVDLGLDDQTNEMAQLFVRGIEPNVWLDPNVDGMIYQELDRLRSSI